MILETTDYDIFKKHPRQRELKDKNVRDLMKSMTEREFFDCHAITCDKNLVVFDGGHRLEAARRLKIPAKYEVFPDLQEEDIRYFQIQKPWLPEDFLTYGVGGNNEHYMKLQSFLQENEITIGLFFRMTKTQEGIGKISDRFKRGEFVYDPHTMQKIRSLLRASKQIIDFIGTTVPDKKKFMANTYFRLSLVQFLSDKRIDADLFWDNIRRCLDMVRHCTSVEEYIIMWHDIYNYSRRTNRVPYIKRK